ncbi:uncharacterized protein LOC141641359 [Silene latifolia]|uniref:uncharacterized protein LOC141641359 n=1 Tax=Silene latifolia TaxID=37657 RepID=UPI003D784697
MRGTGLRLVLKSPQGDLIAQAVSCEFKAINNEAESETLIAGLKVTSTPGYPKANGQAKSSNKVVISCLEKKLKKRKGRWPEELPLVLWADRTTPKTSTDQTPYSMVYGCEAVIPAEIHVPTTSCNLNTVEENQPLMQDSLTLAKELSDAAKIRIASYQQTVTRSYNKNVNIRVFREGDLVLRNVFLNTKDKNAGKLDLA